MGDRQPAGGSAPAARGRARLPGRRGSTAAILDQTQVNAFISVAEREPSERRAPRAAGQFVFRGRSATTRRSEWYSDALRLSPNEVEVSTDLGVSYYYANQPEKALEQFGRSLKIDPKHAKTFLHVGIVKWFSKQDLPGAQQAWEQVHHARAAEP